MTRPRPSQLETSNTSRAVVVVSSSLLAGAVAAVIAPVTIQQLGMDLGVACTAALSSAVAVGLSRIVSRSAPRINESSVSLADQSSRGVHGSIVAHSSIESAESVLRMKAMELRLDERTRLLDGQSDAVVLVDAHGETRHANLAAKQWFGERGTTLGTSAFIKALPEAARRAVTGVVASACGERRRVEGELVAVASCDTKDSPRSTETKKTPVSMHITHLAGAAEPLVAVVLRDLTAEREADRLKADFIAKVNHELRTPLSSLRAYAEMLGDGELADESERARAARVIIESTERLSALVDGMLDISAIESGMARADFVSCDIASLCTECVTEQRLSAEARRIELHVKQRTTGAMALADRTLLKQVVLNLLSNAIKYTPEGGRVEIEVDLDNLARSVVVSVRDNGLGIPIHAIPRLFGKFYRVAGHEKVAKGTGLGLNLCRNIVEELHGGQIGVESQVGEGSRFWFAIPLEQAGRKAA